MKKEIKKALLKLKKYIRRNIDIYDKRFGVQLSRAGEHLYNLTKKKFHNIANFTRFNASIKARDNDDNERIWDFMYRLRNKYNLKINLAIDGNDYIFLWE